MMIASIWLQQGHHLTPLESGMMTLGYLVNVLAMIRVGEKLLQRYGARLPMMAGPVSVSYTHLSPGPTGCHCKRSRVHAELARSSRSVKGANQPNQASACVSSNWVSGRFKPVSYTHLATRRREVSGRGE